MIFGNASWGFRETPLEEQLRITKDMGLTVLELGIANAPKDVPLSVSDEEISRVISLYDKYGIDLCCAATGNDFSNGDKNDVPKVKKTAHLLKVCCNFLFCRIFLGSAASIRVDRTCKVDSIAAIFNENAPLMRAASESRTASSR